MRALIHSIRSATKITLSNSCPPTRRISSGVGIIGAPFSKGQSKAGTERAPLAIREAGLVPELQRLGWTCKDYGDLKFERHAEGSDISSGTHNVKCLSDVARAVDQLSGAVATVLRDDHVPLTLGGDHSLAIGSISGHFRDLKTVEDNELCVIWIDAHADINTIESSRTGNMHGMPVSFLIKEMAGTLKATELLSRYFPNIRPCISAKNFAYIGLRDLDEAEMNFVRSLEPSLAIYSIRDIDKLGIFEVMGRVLEKINPNLKRKIHVSFDIDSIDEYFAPSTGTSVPGGLSMREAFCIGEQIAATKKLAGLDLVEVNPMLGSDLDVRRTVNCAINIILSFLGKQRMSLYARHPSEQFYGVQD